MDKSYRIKTGHEAITEYVASNVGRTVELSAELLGEVSTGSGQISKPGEPEEAETEKVYGASVVDSGQTGRLFLGIKRLLGNTGDTRLSVFDRKFRLVALMTPQLLRIQQTVQENLQSLSREAPPADHACIGHPVVFEGRRPERNTTALARLAEAYSYAGFARQCFYQEPTAAALSYAHTHPVAEGQRLLAVDFGGGTLDLCIIRRQNSGFELIATHGVGLGGDHIDQMLFRELLFPLLGKGERWRRAGEDREVETLFPFDEYEDLLLNWAVSYMLNQNRYTAPLMQRIQVGDEGAAKFQRLYDLIKNNYSHLVFQSLKQFKAELSSADEATLDIPELDIELRLSRQEFEALIAGLLADFGAAIDTVLAEAGLTAENIELVIRTGGSSLIPAVRKILDERFPDKVIEHDPFTSVAAGLAIAEYYAGPGQEGS